MLVHDRRFTTLPVIARFKMCNVVEMFVSETGKAEVLIYNVLVHKRRFTVLPTTRFWDLRKKS